MTGYNTSILYYESDGDANLFERAYDAMATWLDENIGYRDITVDDLQNEIFSQFPQLTDKDKAMLIRMGGF